MSVGDNIRQVLIDIGCQPVELANALGHSTSAVSQMLAAEEPRHGTLMKYATAINAILADRGDPRRVTADSLRHGPELTRSGQEDQSLTGVSLDRLRGWITVKVYDGAACGNGAVGQDVEAVSEMLVPPDMGPAQHLAAVLARGDSMVGAGIEHGTAVIVRTNATVADLRPGRKVLIQRNGASAELRQVASDGLSLVSVGRDGERLVEVQPMDEVIMLGLVVGWYHRE